MRVSADPPREAQNVDAPVDLAGLAAALWRDKWKVIGPTVVVAVLTLAAVQFVTPRYLSEARVIVEDADNVYLRPDAGKDVGNRTVDEQAIFSQAQLILSRDLAREVIDRLKLGERSEFDPTLSKISSFRELLGLLGLIKDPRKMTPEERVLDAYYDRLTVSPIDKSRVITIDFVSADPELAARVANAVAEAYLVRQRQAKQEQARAAGEWLAGEIGTMRKKVAEAQGKVETFRAKAGLLIGTNSTTLPAQQLGDFNAQLTAARAQKADAESKAKTIRDMLRSGAALETSDILNSQLFRRLSEQRVTLRAQLAEQSSTLLDEHPRIKELRAQIADLSSQMRTEAETIARSFENDAKLADARVDTLGVALDQLKGQAASSNEQDVQLRALEMDAKAQRDLLESYLAKYREAASRDTINSAGADARLFSRATVSNVPAYPKKLPTVLIATVTTLILSSGLVLTAELLAAPAPQLGGDAAEPAIAREDPAFAGALPGVRLANASVPSRSDAISGSEIAKLAEKLRQAGEPAARIAVFGMEPGVNASRIAIRLARMLAEEARVVLVGLSSDQAIRKISNEPDAGGLAELASGTAGFGEIITKDRLSPLHLIAPGRSFKDDAAFSAPALITDFDALTRSYDHVVFDAGPPEGPKLKAMGAIGAHAILLGGVADASELAREALLAAGCAGVTVLPAERPRLGAAA